MTDENGITQRSLSNEMLFVFARGEIDGGVVFRCHFAINRHGKGNGDEWNLNVGAASAPRRVRSGRGGRSHFLIRTDRFNPQGSLLPFPFTAAAMTGLGASA